MTDKRIKMECPFCHCPPERIQLMPLSKIANNGWRVKCPNCRATFDTWTNKQEAINMWNRR